MKKYENNNFKVVVDENNVTVINKFGDKYTAVINENNKLVAKSAFALKYAMKARRELNF